MVDSKGYRPLLLKKLQDTFSEIKEIKAYVGGFTPISLIAMAIDHFKIFESDIDVIIMDLSILVPCFSIMYKEHRQMYNDVLCSFFNACKERQIKCITIHGYHHAPKEYFSIYYNNLPRVEVIGENSHKLLQECIGNGFASESYNPTLHLFNTIESQFDNVTPVYVCNTIDHLIKSKKYELGELYQDLIHPHKKGSEIISDMIFDVFQSLTSSNKSSIIHTPIPLSCKCSLNNINHNVQNYTNSLINVQYSLVEDEIIYKLSSSVYSIILLMDTNNCSFTLNNVAYQSYNKELGTLLCKNTETPNSSKYIIELRLDNLISDKSDITFKIQKDNKIDYKAIDYKNNQKLLDMYDIDYESLNKNNRYELKIIGVVEI